MTEGQFAKEESSSFKMFGFISEQDEGLKGSAWIRLQKAGLEVPKKNCVKQNFEGKKI